MSSTISTSARRRFYLTFIRPKGPFRDSHARTQPRVPSRETAKHYASRGDTRKFSTSAFGPPTHQVSSSYFGTTIAMQAVSTVKSASSVSFAGFGTAKALLESKRSVSTASLASDLSQRKPAIKRKLGATTAARTPFQRTKKRA